MCLYPNPGTRTPPHGHGVWSVILTLEQLRDSNCATESPVPFLTSVYGPRVEEVRVASCSSVYIHCMKTKRGHQVVFVIFVEDLVRVQSKREYKHSLGGLSIHISAVPSSYIGVTGGLKGRVGKLYNLGPHFICLGCRYKYTS